jgi:protein subunit release factor A
MSTGQSNRDRIANQKEAFNNLVRKIIAFYDNGPEPRRIMSNVVRTYHFERNVVTNGRISKPIQEVINGEIDSFIEDNLLNGIQERNSGRV